MGTVVISAAEYNALRGAGRPRRAPAADIEGPVHKGVLDALRLLLGPAYLVQHTPNRPRSRIQGGREKRLGAVRGWPDLAIFGRGPAGSAVWFAEIKPPGVQVPAYQREIHARLQSLGFPVAVLRGPADVQEALAAWGIPVAAPRPGGPRP